MPSDREAALLLSRCRALVDAAVRRALARHRQLGLSRIVRYHLGYTDEEGRRIARAGGKGARSALCLLTCEAAGGDARLAAPAGAAIELTHGFTLLHDDIVDQDERRRGRPSVWRVWGIGQAITAGDAVFALANLTLAGPDATVPLALPPGVRAAALRELNQATLEVCEGQHLDISYEGRMQVSVPDYLRMIGLKTAPLFRAAASIGAQVGGASAEQVRLLSRFGHELGLAYQIRDDLLGMWGDPGRIGKPVGSDLRQNKRSLPIVLALASDDPHLRAHVEEALSRGIGSEEEASSLAAEIEADGARGACEQFADRCLDRALRHLRKAGPRDESAAGLQALATYFVHRQE